MSEVHGDDTMSMADFLSGNGRRRKDLADWLCGLSINTPTRVPHELWSDDELDSRFKLRLRSTASYHHIKVSLRTIDGAVWAAVTARGEQRS